MPSLTSIIEKRKAEFDEKFGTDGPEKNSDSLGRMAGCDDCVENINLRAEHKFFHSASILAVLQAVKEGVEAHKKVLNPNKEIPPEIVKTTTFWNAALTEISTLLESEISKLK